MKVLIISGDFYPVNSPRSFRTTELAKELSRQGNEVTLMYSVKDESSIEFCQQNNIHLIDLGPLKWRSFLNSNNKIINIVIRIINRLLLQLFEYPSIELMFRVRKALSKITAKYDLLITIAVPHTIHWGVSLIGSKRRNLASCWVADCGDPFMGDRNDSFNKLFYFAWFEHKWCKRADFITIPKIEMKKNFYPKYHDKFVEIPQGFNFNETKKLIKPYSGNKIPTFAYAGAFIQGRGGRDPRPLLDFLLSTNEQFSFVIYTRNRSLLSKYIEKADPRLQIYDVIPRSSLLQELSNMDFLINIAYDPESQLPSKLIDYALVGRPILNIYNDKLDEKLKADLLDFLKGNYSNKLKIDGIDKYNIEAVAKKFLELANKKSKGLS